MKNIIEKFERKFAEYQYEEVAARNRNDYMRQKYFEGKKVATHEIITELKAIK